MIQPRLGGVIREDIAVFIEDRKRVSVLEHAERTDPPLCFRDNRKLTIELQGVAHLSHISDPLSAGQRTPVHDRRRHVCVYVSTRLTMRDRADFEMTSGPCRV